MTYETQESLFTIKTVAKLTGLTTHTLRAWENRYQAVVPQRSGSGQRTYNLPDVERLRLLKKLTDFGYSISKVANESIEKLRSLCGQMEVHQGRMEESVSQMQLTPSNAEKQTQRIVSQTNTLEELNIIQNLKAYKLEEINRKMLDARVALGARNFAIEIVLPLMREVGFLYASDKITIAQEHSLSAIVRNHLGQIIQVIGWNIPQSNPKIALATPTNDYHEIPILIAQILCLVAGYQVHFLGPNLPEEALADAASALGCEIILLGATDFTGSLQNSSLKDYLETLGKKSSKGTKIWIGGSATRDLTIESRDNSYTIINDMQNLERKLAEYIERPSQ